MSIHNLDKIFDPKRVAVCGASNKTTSVGYTVLRNLISAGFPGVVYPVNPKRESVQGIQAYPETASLPHPPVLVRRDSSERMSTGLVWSFDKN